MADPFRLMSSIPNQWGVRVLPGTTAGQIQRRDPLGDAMHLISRHEMRVWFEPDWQLGRILARRFPHCLVCSIPEESVIAAHQGAPVWRDRQINRRRVRLLF